MEYTKWIKAGKELGLANEGLMQFVEKAQREAEEREARMQERDEARRRDEAEQKRLEQERTLEILRLQQQMASTNGNSNGNGNGHDHLANRPRLPKFDDKSDQMDAYLERFERFAGAQNWNRETWSASLSPLLSGRGLEVYVSLSADVANNYAVLKRALLKRYQLTEDGFRQKFRTASPEVDETVVQYIARLKRYLERWIEMADVERSFDKLLDLLLREQFTSMCNKSLSIFLKERVPSDIGAVEKLAEQFLEAHATSTFGQTNKRQDRNDGNGKERSNNGFRAGGDYNRSKNDKQRKNSQVKCFRCNQEGHFARYCRKSPPLNHSKPTSQGWVAAACDAEVETETLLHNNLKDGRLVLADGSSIPYLGASC